MKELKYLHPRVECWRGCVCPGHGQCHTKLFFVAVKNKKWLKSLHPSVECWRGCLCPEHVQCRPKLFPGAVKNKKGSKSLHPSVECWRGSVCPRHGQWWPKLFPGAVKKTLSFTNFSISPERKEALEYPADTREDTLQIHLSKIYSA